MMKTGRTIGGGERRRLSLILLGEADLAPGAAAQDEEPALRQAITAYGGSLERLADGSWIAVLEGGRQVATDHAAKTARCALALHALGRGRSLALALGRAEPGSRLPDRDALAYAAELLASGARALGGAPRIVLDEVLAGLLDARFDVAETETGLVLHGERALAAGARTLLGRPTSYVGRDWELDALAGILDEGIEEARARAALVIAPAGMGKSRLCAELVGRVQRRDEEVAIWIGRGDSLRAGSTLDLLAQALRGALGIRGGEPLPERWEKIRARVGEHVPAGDRQRVAEFLGELVGAPFPAEGEGGAALRAARQDAQLMSEQMRRAWLDFLGAETSARPVLLVLEDLHWGDFGTVQFLDLALRERRDRPWMVLALARPELYDVFPKLWSERQGVQEIRLKALGRKASERLVRQVLGDGVDPRTMARLVTQADGNAFYLEELIRAVAGGEHAALPETVLAMVEARLAQLPQEARRVLRAASVFGEVCWERGVALLLDGMGAAAVEEWIGRLIEQELLAVRPESRFPGERELALRHALLREGAYATLTGEGKRLGHRLAGEWLERHGETDPMVLAGHFERGGEGTRAAGYYLRAAEQALHIVDLDAVVRRAGLGLGCAPPQDLRHALLGIRCSASGSFQLLSVALADAEELMRTARRGSLPWAQAMLAYTQGTLLSGRIPELMAAIAQLREVEPEPAARGRLAFACVVAACILDLLGQVAEGTALEARLSEIVRPHAADEPIARFWWNTALALRASYAHDDPWRALQHCDEIRRIFEAVGGETFYLNLQLFRGLNHWYLGALAPAALILDEIRAGDEVLGLVASVRSLGLAWARADRGALDEARAVAVELAERGRARRHPVEEARGRWALAEVLRRQGELAAAERELESALAMAPPLEQPGVRGTLAALHLAQGRAGEALAAAEDALARYAAMGACGMFRGAFVRLAHAEALHATGAHDAARQAIARARTYLLTVAGKIPDPAYRRSFLEEVPENARTLARARAWLGEDVESGSEPAAGGPSSDQSNGGVHE